MLECEAGCDVLPVVTGNANGLCDVVCKGDIAMECARGDKLSEITSVFAAMDGEIVINGVDDTCTFESGVVVLVGSSKPVTVVVLGAMETGFCESLIFCNRELRISIEDAVSLNVIDNEDRICFSSF